MFKVGDSVRCRCGDAAGIYEVDEENERIYGWRVEGNGDKLSCCWYFSGAFFSEPGSHPLDLVLIKTQPLHFFALDYDKTYTLNPEYWKKVIALGEEHGIEHIIVTARRDTLDNRAILDNMVPDGVQIVYCDLKSKVEVCTQRNIAIDVWIDDDPVTLVRGH